MSDPQTIGAFPAGGANVRTAIARAAEKTGIDFRYLLAQARLESSLDPGARAATSSAAGLYQFTRGTWLQTLDRHGANHGFGWAGEAIDRGRITNPALQAQVMALRYDADASALMAAELARDNRAELAGVLGREPDAAELYLGHFLGIGGATTFLSALSTNPGQSAAAILPKAAAANRTIFYQPGGAPRSVSAMMDLIRGKVARAMEEDGRAWVEHGGFTAGPVANEEVSGWDGAASAYWSSHPQASTAPGPDTRPSQPRPGMADTLRDTFGLASADGAAAAPRMVRAAYDKLQRFGL